MKGMFKLTEEQVHELSRISEEIDLMRHDIEDTGKNRRIVKKLDDISSAIYSILWDE